MLKQDWTAFTKEFFVHRNMLLHVLLLVDASVPAQDVDVDCANWLAGCQVPFAIVFTKTDNRKKELPPPPANIRCVHVCMRVCMRAACMMCRCGWRRSACFFMEQEHPEP